MSDTNELRAVKLTRRHQNALRYLAKHPGHQSQSRIPNGHGYASGGHYASGDTLRDLRHLGLVEFGYPGGRPGFAITAAGLALSTSDARAPSVEEGKYG